MGKVIGEDFNYSLDKKDLLASGIYCITNSKSNKKYIGSSLDMYFRIATHKSKLKANKHDNIHLQRSFNKHGIKTFNVKVLEFCTEKDLARKEQYWIDSLSPEFNIGGVTDGRKNIVNVDTKIKISRSLLKLRGISKIQMLHKNTKEPIRAFDSLVEAAIFIKTENSLSGQLRNIRARIANVANEKIHYNGLPAKTAFGFKWRYE